MYIEKVDVFPLYHKLSRPYGDANGIKSYRACCLIRITTRSGLTGWGEAVGALPELVRQFKERIIPFLTGKPATDRSPLVRTVRSWNARAAAGVSLALTEIAAKRAGMSVCDYWGGRFTEEIPVYASFQSYGNENNWMDYSFREVEAAVESGFRLAKLKIGGRPAADDRRHIGEVQARYGGTLRLMLDGNESYDAAEARSWEWLFSGWSNIEWLEEPIPLDRTADYRMLRSALCVPIAGGENIAKPEGFLPLLSAEGLDFAMPDIMHLGGVDEFRFAQQLARRYGRRVSPHTFDGVVSRLYTLFAQACLEPWSKMKGEPVEPVEWDVMENPLADILPLEAKDGQVRLPDGPGMGCEPDMERVQALLWDGSALPG